MCCTEQTTGFVVHMRDEHRRLRELLLQIEQNWTAVNEGSEDAAPNVGAGLRSLRVELAHHFAEEEDGGCLEEAACRCPSLTEEVSRVEGEHGELLSQLDAVIEDVPVTPNPVAMSKPHILFARFTKKLREHETAENELLETAFGSGVES